MIHQLFTLFNWLGSEWILAVLFTLSVICGAVVLARWFELLKLKKASERFWAEHGESWFTSNDIAGWEKNLSQLRVNYPCLETEVLEIIHKNKGGSNEDMERAINAFLDHKKMKLERQVGVLGTIGANAPFIGLLGTVLGIIRSFHDISVGGLSQGMESIGGGIAEALVATAVGLIVAIPAVVFFNILNKRISNLSRKARTIGDLILSRGGK